MTADRIFLSPPDVGELEKEYVLAALDSGWIAPLGPQVDSFEAELAQYCGRRHCVVLSSGTAALHLGLITLGIGSGDVVVTSSMTFAATANAIRYVGAEPVFVDSDSSGNVNPDLLSEAVDDLRRQGVEPRAIVPVDLLGKVVDHGKIAALAQEHGLPVVSDAAESLGARRDDRPAASFGTLAAVSFNGNKVMTTSGGGALLTDDGPTAERVRYLATQARQPVAHYEHTEVGYNYRMSNLLAALGRAQLSRLDTMIGRRREHRLWYRSLFAGVPGVTVFGEPSGLDGGPTQDNFWLTSILVEPNEAGFTAEELRLALAASNIEARPLWKPMHLQPAFAGFRAYVDGTSERLFRDGISLPSGSGLSESDQGRVTDCIVQFLRSR